MSGWFVRHEGSPRAVRLASPAAVLVGLRDGEWEPTDEVRGPADAAWVAIADHPLFEEAAAELAPLPPPPVDDSRLDMNPLIDVALVLLLVIMLQQTVAGMHRVLEVPEVPKATQQPAAAPPTDKLLRVKLQVVAGRVTVEVNGEAVPVAPNDPEQVKLKESLVAKFQPAVKAGRNELLAEVAGEVPWGVEVAVYDAAKKAGVKKLLWPKGK